MKKIKLFILVVLTILLSLRVYAEEGTRWSITANIQQELSDLIKHNSLPTETFWILDKKEFAKQQEQLKREAEEQNKVLEDKKPNELNENKDAVKEGEQVKEPALEAKKDAPQTTEDYVHIMQKQDTLYSVAKKYNVDLNKILADNNIKDPKSVKEGDRIKISGVAVENVVPNVSEYVYYKVLKGDTLYKIASKFSMEVDEILAINNIEKENAKKQILPGKVLKLKDMGRVDHYAGNDVIKSKDGDKAGDKDRFEWPLVGRILKDYGASLNGTINEGINIKANKNSVVKTTEDGTVIYSGKALEAFGNLILIQHDNNWISAYAHLESIMVKKGQKVKKGDSVGRVGETGYVTSPQLHFELRKNSEPVDPLKFLKSYR